MFWKDQLASLILANTSITKDWLVGLEDRFPSLRVKTVDAAGKVPVIQLNGKREWMKPKEWAENHLANLKQQRSELQSRILTVTGIVIETSLDSAGPDEEAYVSKIQELQNDYDFALENYLQALSVLKAMARGSKMDVLMLTKINKMINSGQDGWITNR